MTETVMGLDRTHPRMLSAEALLEGIEAGKIVLPDFQRDFDWLESDVRSLLSTVLSGWPAGSLLFMTGDNLYFRVRGLEGGPQPSPTPQFVVLDGQQRLTALYHAFRDTGPTRFAIDWERVGEGRVDDLDDAILSFDPDVWAAEYGTAQSQLDSHLVPLSALHTASDFFSWRDTTIATLGSEQRSELSRTLAELYRRVFANAQTYEFPAIVVTSRINPGAIARIFERLNRSGQTLNAFDLMVAISYEPAWNLRDHWEEARRSSALIDRYLKDDGLPVLQVIALRTSRDIREQAVLALDGSVVRQEWASAVAGMERALEFVAEHGVMDQGWMPYRVVPVVLGALAADAAFDLGEPRLDSWFWSTGFGQAYDVASNTRAVSDFVSLLRGESASHPVLLESLISATRRRNAPIWRSFLSALVANGAEDLVSGIRLSVDGSMSDTVIQPTLPRLDVEGDVSPHLKVMNLLLASRGTAQRIRRDGVVAVLGGEEVVDESRLVSQFMPPTIELERLLYAWPELLEQRGQRLSAFLVEQGVEVLTQASG